MERHPLDLVSLTAGLVFTAVAAIGLTGAIALGVADLRWIGPALLVLFGVVLVATSVSRRDDRPVDASASSAASAAPAAPATRAAGTTSAGAATQAGTGSGTATGTDAPPTDDPSAAR